MKRGSDQVGFGLVWAAGLGRVEGGHGLVSGTNTREEKGAMAKGPRGGLGVFVSPPASRHPIIRRCLHFFVFCIPSAPSVEARTGKQSAEARALAAACLRDPTIPHLEPDLHPRGTSICLSVSGLPYAWSVSLHPAVAGSAGCGSRVRVSASHSYSPHGSPRRRRPARGSRARRACGSPTGRRSRG